MNILKNDDLIIKEATLDDMIDVFNLSNDPLVRQNSFNPEKIKLEDHKDWYSNKINSENTFFYIIRDQLTTELISYIRFEKEENDEYIVSIAISEKFRGKGLGSWFLKATSSEVINKKRINKINAFIKPENITSIKTFKKAGYVEIDNNSEKVRLEYK